MTTAYGWLDSFNVFRLSIYPKGHNPRPSNEYATPQALLEEVQRRGMTLQWDDPAAVDAWVKAKGKPMNPTSNGVTAMPVIDQAPPPQEVLPPLPKGKPMDTMTAAMSLTPTVSIAHGMLAAVGNLRSMANSMVAETAAINAVVEKINSKVTNLKKQREALEDLSDNLNV